MQRHAADMHVRCAVDPAVLCSSYPRWSTWAGRLGTAVTCVLHAVVLRIVLQMVLRIMLCCVGI